MYKKLYQSLGKWKEKRPRWGRHWLAFLILGTLGNGIWGCADSENHATVESPAVMRPTVPWDTLIGEFEDYLQDAVQSNCVPGLAVAIVHGDSTVYSEGFGVRDIASGTPVDSNTLFKIGSLSKGFGALAAAVLVDRGDLRWDERVIDILPDFALRDTAQTKRIEIRHLLTHSTGLARHTFTNLIEDGKTIPEIMARLPEVEVLWPEGEQFAYQNVTFAMIQEVIRAKTGLDFATFLDREILRPAGMRRATSSQAAFRSSLNRTRPHREIMEGFAPVALNGKYENAIAAGGIAASARDMADYLKILLGERPDIIGSASLNEMFEPQIATGSYNYFNEWEGVDSSAYGFGFRVHSYKGREIIHHGGMVNDFRSELMIDPINDIGVCILFNANSGVAREVVPTFLHLLQLSMELQV